MKAYFVRRLLLVPITMLGVTLLVFAVTRVVPGGPVERAMREASAAGDEGSSGGGASQQQGGLSEEGIEEVEREFNYDKSIPVAYLMWLGVIPKEGRHSDADFTEGAEETIGDALVEDPETQAIIELKGTGRQALVKRDGKEVVSATFLDTGADIATEGWSLRIELPADRQAIWAQRYNKTGEEAPDNYDVRVTAFKTRFAGLLQGQLGYSKVFGDSVGNLILDRIPIAAYFGILYVLITYSICLPLGVLKAIKHRTAVDNVSSILIFIGYSIPGFALGALLLVYFGRMLGWFPLIGFTSPDFDTLDAWGKVKDLAHHTFLPLICYIIGGFAWLTMMMKNNLMDNLAADYVRTAVAKGVKFRTAVFRHAFRNSFIPIASTLGGIITIFISGSLLIETVFDIQGFGLLQFQGLLERDAFVIMGTMTIAAFLMLMGNILSDIIVASIDPRVKFDR
ncbi:MAG: ABC transporter permease [Akkermansiaceae bacterium]|nr:ABC transporter permease [Akkermansiaceae bacterium]